MDFEKYESTARCCCWPSLASSVINIKPNNVKISRGQQSNDIPVKRGYSSGQGHKAIKTFMLLREKGREFTQSYAKSPYTHRKTQKATWQHTNATQNFDYITITDRFRTVSWGNDSNPTGVVKPVYGIPTYPLTAKAVKQLPVEYLVLWLGSYKLENNQQPVAPYNIHPGIFKDITEILFDRMQSHAQIPHIDEKVSWTAKPL